MIQIRLIDDIIVNLDLQGDLKIERLFENLQMTEFFKRYIDKMKVIESEFLSENGSFNTTKAGKMILSFVLEALAWFSEKVDRINNSEYTDKDVSIENQRYPIKFDENDNYKCDNCLTNINDKNGTSKIHQNFVLPKSNKFRVYELDRGRFFLEVYSSILVSDVFDFGDDFFLIGNDKIMNRNMLLNPGTFNINVVQKLFGGNPKDVVLSDDDEEYEYEEEDEDEEIPAHLRYIYAVKYKDNKRKRFQLTISLFDAIMNVFQTKDDTVRKCWMNCQNFKKEIF
jgi:hypothetical protein